jgi:hypothetical protein
VVHLRLLRLLDRHGRIREIRARVLQRLAVEPELVEVVAEVVVVVNVALGVVQVGRQLAAAREDPADGGVFRRVTISLEQHRQQVAAHHDAPGAVEIAEVQVGVDQELPQRFSVHDAHAHDALAGRHFGLVPELDPHRRRPEVARNLLDQPAVEAARLLARGSRAVERDVGPGNAQRLHTTSIHFISSACNFNTSGRSKPLPPGLWPSSTPAGMGCRQRCQIPSPRLRAAARSVLSA